MRIIKKINEKAKDLKCAEPVTIAFLGDSVTQGCFGLYHVTENAIDTYFEAENAYHTKLKKIINKFYPNVPINIINAGISGGKAWEGIDRLQRDVLKFSPNLCVVCFGLNDASVENMPDAKQKYIDSLRTIFTSLQQANIEVIYMTPNMMCTNVSSHIESAVIRKLAEQTTVIQNEGRLNDFLEAGKSLAQEMAIPICDCYSQWRTLYDNEIDITNLLSNYVNHPTAEMHWLFAIELFKTMLYS